MTAETILKEIPYAAADAYREGRLDDLDFLLNQWSENAIEGHPVMYGDTVFMRHTYNGLIALDKGDVELAKRELLMSGKSPKSAMFGSVGPNMALAKRLLEAGEKETVFRFFDYCKNFWLLPVRLYFVTKWKRAINSGQTPDFRFHLMIFMERLPKDVSH
jgi:hypothetical protein